MKPEEPGAFMKKVLGDQGGRDTIWRHSRSFNDELLMMRLFECMWDCGLNFVIVGLKGE